MTTGTKAILIGRTWLGPRLSLGSNLRIIRFRTCSRLKTPSCTEKSTLMILLKSWPRKSLSSDFMTFSLQAYHIYSFLVIIMYFQLVEYNKSIAHYSMQK